MKNAIMPLIVATAVGATVGTSFAQEKPKAFSAPPAGVMAVQAPTAPTEGSPGGQIKLGTAGAAAQVGAAGLVQPGTVSTATKAQKKN
jgi:hypothetical protein